MVEYETLGIVLAVVGVVSVQIQMVNNRLKDELAKAEKTHEKICNKITSHFKKCKCHNED